MLHDREPVIEVSLLAILIDRTNDAIFLVDVETGLFTYVNARACANLGYSKQELLGGMGVKNVEAILPDNFSWKEHIEALRKRGKNLIVQGMHRRKDGSTFPIEASICLTEHQGKEYNIVFVRDISERRKREDLIAEQQKTIITTAKMAALGEMAGGMAHEINTPLAAIGLNASQIIELLEEETFDRSIARDGLQTINVTVDRIAKIIKGLLFFSRSGKKPSFEKVTFRGIVEATLGFCTEKLRSSGISLELPEIPGALEIECHPVELSQVVLNLINNAFDAVDGGETEEKKWIKVEFRSDGNNIELMITNSGKGIPVELRGKIFQPFFTTKPIGSGTGLGLSIAKGIIENHGGSLALDYSCPNTRFVMQLPISQSEGS